MHEGPPQRESEDDSPLEREARLRALMAVAFDGMVICENGTVVEVGQAVLALWGYEHDAVIGRPVADFLAPECREIVRERHVASVEGRIDVVGITSNGERRRIEAVSRIYVERERATYLMALHDVTEVRRLEQRVEHQQRVEALGRLAAGVAHDFNNVLNTIRSFGELLSSDVDPRHRSDVREILKAAETGAALVRHLLMYARHKAPRPALIDVNAIVRGAEGMVRRLVGSGVEVVTSLGPDVGAVWADPTELQQAILNLAINARDAMPHGGTLTLRTQVVESERPDRRTRSTDRCGRFVLLLVSDSGTGIADEVKARIFEPFFTTKESDEGTGLGLAIVQRIVQRSGGFVRVASEVGSGSTFSIYLPAAN